MSHYRGVARDEYGNSLYEAQVSVFAPDTTTLSTIYSDPELVTALVNPFSTGEDGVYEFYAAPGYYDIQVAKTGFTTVALGDTLVGAASGHLIGDTAANDTVTTAAEIAVDDSFGVGPWTAGYLGGFSDQLGVLKYEGNPQLVCRLSASIHLYQVAVATRDYTVRIVRDFGGSPEVLAFATVTADQANYVTTYVAGGATLDKDDELTLTLQVSGADTATFVTSADFFIQGLD